ncbi:MAG: Glutamate--cysteine ligase [Gammaproteobacteria bacterium]|nr:Glutamate--cysteine ligase [Gammaproteobacteria bacterium]
MGQEINRIVFSEAHFRDYESRLRRETEQLDEWLASDRIEHGGHVFGFEAEAWLIDHNHFPAAHNEALLDRLANPLVRAELSRFNVELNGTPRTLGGGALRGSEDELQATWRECQRVAHAMGDALILIGILPTIRNADLSLANMSPLNRYRALNDQVLRRRHGRSVKVDIAGRERLTVTHTDVMLEAATTSFQAHLKVPVEDAVRHYNAALIGSGPILAACANSPFLFGRSLWEETRVPLFEQSVGVGGEGAGCARVTFGSGYLRNSVGEYFHENLERFPILLPVLFESTGRLDHLRLHNGTIWRWNRLLPGFDDAGHAHVRIEHRPLPAGPSIVDMIANAALYVGLTHFLAMLGEPPESELPFEDARSNFYAAARLGADARLRWLGGTVTDARSLLLGEMLPMARHGLKALDVDAAEVAHYLEVVRMRVQTGQTGAAWQRGFVDRHGRDPLRLTAAYLENQRSGAPVHEWEF